VFGGEVEGDSLQAKRSEVERQIRPSGVDGQSVKADRMLLVGAVVSSNMCLDVSEVGLWMVVNGCIYLGKWGWLYLLTRVGKPSDTCQKRF